ncbi:glycoside hydrolase family 10 protein [Serendipita vermifera MAFF 305830]|uniref:Beta-xylanase n=1 Tax=Serendipita vermifera MAFF 305830 TaxID=933852 RepID=A0A0C2WUY2_SERVB|nr:glycoside hydrolase family 10 protein [Serendipita vermifera MAFF 305830]
MKVVSVAFAATLFSLQTVQAAVPLWGQCGGVVYTGDVTCTSGAICQKWNDWFSQCIPGPTSTSSIRSSTSTLKSTSTSKTSSTTSVSRTTVTSSSTVSRTTVTSTSTVSRTSTTVSSSASATPTLAPLHDLAKAAGKQYFGVAVDTNELANATYKVLLDNTHLFGQITPGNKMKWDATEPSQGTFTFSAADALVTWAQGNGYQIRGHTLVWHSQLPSWVTSGAFSNATLVSILGNHVTNLVTHFKGSVKTWDVVNEIFNEDGTFRTSVFYTTIGETYVDIAFRAAAAADPDVGLAANDYNLDYGGAKMQAYVTLVNTLKSRGVKITQIGSQSHLIVGSTPSQSSLANVFATLAATGVEVAVTELDIRMTLPVTDALLAQQKKDYYNVVAACVQTSGCIGVTIWAYSDYYSWIPSVFSGQGAALPFDEYLQPKPAFYGIAEALTGTTTTTSSTTSISTSTTSVISSTSTSSSSSTSASATPTLAPLNDLAKAAGKQYFGVAVDSHELANATYRVLLDNTHLFGQITPGNKMKWDATEPSRGTFTFSAADALVTWAQGNGYEIRGHTLVWHSQLPSWVSSGGFDNATLVSILENHVTNLVTHFKGSIKTWDVVNEIFNEDGTFRTSVFYTTIGEYYVDIAFRAAAAADPNVRLAANDYNLDYGGAKMQAYVTLVNTLKSRGVKITQIGSQSHLIVGSTPSQNSLANVFATLAATGVEVAVTELDIRMTLPVTDALLAQQKKDYYNVVAACVQTSGCIGVTIWAYSDYYSWIPSVFSGQVYKCPRPLAPMIFTQFTGGRSSIRRIPTTQAGFLWNC